ncbi:hypothetical protein [Rhodonellum sp.]|uniref:hypothetical protein n=1 Tax=Rhodonellum sp. TaxID=2231180 RepID=UPI002728DA9A|nr:hypothetical protein [Rhodonellum sp.]MDO9554118.1 hypothetical protein [Rhodonellum sp.]
MPIPTAPEKQDINMEANIHNRRQSLQYKVELCYGEDCKNRRVTERTAFQKCFPKRIPIV